MRPLPKLRSIKPTAKEEIEKLKTQITALEEDRDSWKREAVEAETTVQKALRLLGCDPVSDDIAQIAEEVRKALELDPLDKRRITKVLAERQVEQAAIERAEGEKEAAEEHADTLSDLLDEALADRRALLRHTGLTDATWSALGGVCGVHLEYRPKPEGSS